MVRFILCCQLNKSIAFVPFIVDRVVVHFKEKITPITVFVITYMTFVTGFASRRVANEMSQVCHILSLNVNPPAVGQVSLTSADVSFKCYERFCLH